MRYVISPFSSILNCLAVSCVGVALLLSAPGCRLGANNSEKLTALKSGEIYDEDGLVTVSITSPSTTALINRSNDSTAFEVSGVCTPDGVSVSLSIDEVPLTSAATCEQGAWKSSIDTTGLTDGTHALTASATRNGRTKVSEPLAFTKNTQIPQLAILTPSNGGYVNSSTDSATFAVSGTCSETGQTVSVTVDGSSATSFNGGDCNGATWAATLSTLGLSAGNHTLQAQVISSSGNSNSSEAVVVTKDLTPPTAAVTSPATSSYVNLGNNSASFAVSGTCNDASASVQVRIDGLNSGSPAACGGVNWNATVSTVALNEGAHTLSAWITDAAGNSASSAAVSITKDTAAPAIAITSPATGSYVNLGSDSATFAISGSCPTATETGRSITIQVDGSNATQSAITCGAGNAWSGTFNTTALSEAAHTLTASLTDAAGNTGASVAISITKDVTAPSVALTYPLASLSINPTINSASYPVKGTCSENARAVAIQVDGAAATGLASNTCSSGAFSATINTTGLSNAAHTITATQTDLAGNTGPSTPASVSVTKDDSLAMGGTFSRTSVAYDSYTGTQAASGIARYSTVGGTTGIVIEEGTTNLFAGADTLTGFSLVNYDGGSAGFTDLGSNSSGGTYHVHWSKTGSGDKRMYSSAYTIDKTASHVLTFEFKSVSVVATNFLFYLKGNSLDGVIYSEKYMGGHTHSTGAWLSTTGTTVLSSETLADGYQRVTYLISPTFWNGSGSQAQFGIYVDFASTGTVEYYFRKPQWEARAYPTTFVGTSRSAEKLTVPTAGSMLPTQGAVVIRAYVDGDQAFATSNGVHVLFGNQPDGSNNNRITLQLNNATPPQISFSTTNASGTFDTLNHSVQLSKGWHSFGVRWSPSGNGLWLDGTKVGTSTFTNRVPSALEPLIYVGSNSQSGGIKHWNQPIDWIAFYQHTPSDAEMDAFTATGATGADNRLDFEGAAFARASTAVHPTSYAQAASGAPRFVTVNGNTGILIEESTTNLVRNGMLATDATDWVVSNDTGSNGAIARVFDSTLGRYAAEYTYSTNGGWGSYFANVLHGYMTSPYFDTTKQYTLRFKAKIMSGSQSLIVKIQQSNSSQVVWSSVTNINPTTSWTEYTYTFTPALAGTAPVLQFFGTISGGAYAVRVTDVQLEQKPYATTYQEYGTTRAAETLTLPVSGNFTQGAWTAVMDFIPTVSPTNKGFYARLFQIQLDANNMYGVTLNNTNGIPYMEAYSGGVQKLTYNGSDSPLQLNVKHRIAVRYDGSTLKMTMFMNGTKTAAGDVTYVEPVGTLPAKMFFGSNSVSGIQPGGIFDRVVIFKSALSDATIQGFGANGAITGGHVDLQFNGSLGQ